MNWFAPKYLAITVSTASILAGGGLPAKPTTPPHEECMEHAGDEVPCLTFCRVCGHHYCSPDCPSKRSDQERSPNPCDAATTAVEEARAIDIDRQIREQMHDLQPYRRDWSQPGVDPEDDYWHLQGSDPRRRTVTQNLQDIAAALSAVLGLDDGNLPKVDSEPLLQVPVRWTRPWLGVQSTLVILHGVTSFVGEIGVARNRDYQAALLAAQSDLQTRTTALEEQAERFESLASGCADLSSSDQSLLMVAAGDVRRRLTVLDSQLEAIQRSLLSVDRFLQRYEDGSSSAPTLRTNPVRSLPPT